MEAPVVPTEHLHEEMQHRAKSSWTLGVALSSALLAGFAAICSLLAGHHANEAMIDQILTSNQWAYYQAKGIKAAVLSSKLELLEADGKTIADKDRQKLGEYKKEQDQIAEEAKTVEGASKTHLARHTIFASGVTLFQIAIAIGAISALTNRRAFWYLSLIFGLAGVFFLVQGLLKH